MFKSHTITVDQYEKSANIITGRHIYGLRNGSPKVPRLSVGFFTEGIEIFLISTINSITVSMYRLSKEVRPS